VKKTVQAEHAKRAAVTVDHLVAKLEHFTASPSKAGPGVQAVMGIGKLLGLIIDRQELRAEIRKPVADPDAPPEMSIDDWTKKYGGNVIEHQS
jgi:hypothetical protein